MLQKGQYSENKDTSKQTRVFFERLSENHLVVDVRNMNQRLQIDKYLQTHHKQSHGSGSATFLSLLIMAAPYVLHGIGKKQLESLQQSRSKAKVPFFWAVASLSHVFNIYMTAKLLTLTCNQNNIVRTVLNTESQRVPRPLQYSYSSSLQVALQPTFTQSTSHFPFLKH